MRIAVVRPVSGTEDSQFGFRIVLIVATQFCQLATIHRQRLIVLCIEHGLTISERFCFLKHLSREESLFCSGRWSHAVGGGLRKSRLGRIQKRHELDPRKIQQRCRLVEMLTDSILRKHVANVQIRKLQEITQVLRELIAINAPHGAATIGHHVSNISFMQQRLERLQHLIALCLGKLLRGRWHFVLTDSIIDVNPLSSLM